MMQTVNDLTSTSPEAQTRGSAGRNDVCNPLLGVQVSTCRPHNTHSKAFLCATLPPDLMPMPTVSCTSLPLSGSIALGTASSAPSDDVSSGVVRARGANIGGVVAAHVSKNILLASQ